MNRILPVITVLISLAVIGCETMSTSSHDVKPDPDAVAIANKWLSIVDAGNYAGAYQRMAIRVRTAELEQQHITFLRAHRAPLGRPLSRDLSRAVFSHTMAGAPDGDYEFLVYKTRFEHKSRGLEIVGLTKESGHWEVYNYRFN